FGGSPAVLGEKITLNGTPYTVIGVMPRGFYFPNRDVQLWTLLTLREQDFANRTNSFLEAVGRLEDGVTFERARTELSTLAERLGRDYPDTNAETGVSVFLMRDNMSPRARTMLLTLTGASLCLLLLTCANLANLLLARAAAHARELAVRAALGAGRRRLVQQLITQSVVITTIGGAAGLVVAVLTVPLFSTLVPQTLPVASQPGLDLRILTLAAAFTALTALGFGVFPALRAGRAGFSALRDGSRAGGGAKQRVRSILVAVEVTMSVVLLITAGLLIRAVWRVLAGVRALPGVESAGFTSGLPMLVTGLITSVEIPGQVSRSARAAGVSHRWVTPQYFRALGIPLRRGRDIGEADTRD